MENKNGLYKLEDELLAEVRKNPAQFALAMNWFKTGFFSGFEKGNMAKNEAMEEDAKWMKSGRDYLMQVPSDKITVEDTLEAFGFGRNGLGQHGK